MTTDPARRAALDLVVAVDTEGAYANLVLPRLLRERRLGSRDAAFATELGYGALRWQGVLDRVLELAGGRDPHRLDPPVRAALRLGTYQLLHLRTPSHAAVHATVELTRDACGPRPVGLVNAVLRKVAAAGWPQWLDRIAPAPGLERVATEHGFPVWVAAALLEALGGDLTELAAALAEDRPVTHLVARPGRISRADLLGQAGPGAVAGPWSPYAVRMAGGDPAAIPAVAAGAAAVQDEGSQLVALATAQFPLAGDEGRWLDTCAGPGGKAALLVGLLPPGGRLVAADLQEHRARLVAGALAAATGTRVTAVATPAVVADGRHPAWFPDTFDRVLVDAPCTGLGALRRRPEVRWRRQPSDVAPLVRLQVELLTAAAAATRPGGIVAYATCSPHPAETGGVVEEVLAGDPRLERVDARSALPGVEALGPGPDVQLWPHRHGTDAMFLALLRKVPGDGTSAP